MSATAISFQFQQSDLSWFLQLRRLAFIGQTLVLVWATFWLQLDLPIFVLMSGLCLIPLAELLFRISRRYIPSLAESELPGALLVWDTLVLTLLLAFSGGPTNPFSIVYLVHVVLSAVLLGTLWTWGITVLSSVCFAALFLWHYPISEFHHMDHGHGLSLHLKGMLVSYLLVATLVAYFLGKILSEKRRVEQRAEKFAHAQQRLAAMTALSSDAAHRLGTPLASIGLAAHELSRLASQNSIINSSEIQEDLELLQQEVLRCKAIISDLCTTAGDAPGEAAQKTSASLLLQQATQHFVDETPSIAINSDLQNIEFSVQTRPIIIALKNLIQNGVEASRLTKYPEPVRISARLNGHWLQFIIEDSGPGMSEQQLAQLKEPFYTTRQGGMGLGVYIAELVALQLGGQLEFYSREGEGTRVSFCVPVRIISHDLKAA